MTRRKPTRSLRPDEADRVLAAMRTMLQAAGTQTALAHRLGKTPQAVSRVLTGEGQPGPEIARAVADAMGITFDELVKGVRSAPAEPRLGSLRGWDEAELIARAKFQWVPEGAWIAIRDIRHPHPPKTLDPDWIGALAADWARILGPSDF